MPSPAERFLGVLQHPVKFRLFLLSKLPAAYFSGIRVKYADESSSEVVISYRWFTRNPFKSTYFACLSMAAEMSTGILAMAFTWEAEPPVSMLVIKTEASYFKKATGKTTFTCEDGLMLQQTINEACASGKSTQFAARSTGKNEAGETIAEFIITWSFKAKESRR